MKWKASIITIILIGYIYLQIIMLNSLLIFVCLLTIGVDIKHNRRKNWIMSQNVKSFLFTQLVVRVDPQICKLNTVHSSMPPSCTGYVECCVVTTQ